MIDDCGFGASSAFGGPCNTPNIERLAANGLKFNRFHTTALCSPTRAALLTGRNHHAVGMGGITEIATSAPGYNSIRPQHSAPLAEIAEAQRLQHGTVREVPRGAGLADEPDGPVRPVADREAASRSSTASSAPRRTSGTPALYDGVTPIEPPKTPEEGYHFTEDLTDQAITWVHQQKSLMPDKPFFMYFAPGRDARPAPRARRSGAPSTRAASTPAGTPSAKRPSPARRSSGLVPADAELSARPAEILAWDDVAEDLKPVLARQMEVYAGFLEHTDHHIGRLVDALDDLGILDDTLIYCIVGDNGASAEGTPNGTFNEFISLNGAAAFETTEFMASHIDEFGSPDAYNHYAVGWAHAMNTPYQWTKQVASHFGGTRNGTIVHWPNGFNARGRDPQPVPPRHRRRRDRPRRRRHARAGVRQRHPADAAARREHALRVRRRRAPPSGGRRSTSRLRATAASTTRAGPRSPATASRGSSARPCPRSTTTCGSSTTPTPTGARHTTSPPSTPTSSHELQRLFLIEAVKYNVLPLDDRRIERFNSDIAGRPVLVKGNTQLLYGGMRRLSENSVLNLKNKSHAVTAEVEVPEGGANGVIIAQGGAFGGWSLYLHEGKPKYCHNLAGLMRFYVEASAAVPAGTHQVRMEFAYDGGGLAKGGTATLYIDGDKVGEGRIDATVPMIYSADETCDVGCDTGTPVSEDYTSAASHFTGKVNWVELDAGDDNHDHLISPEELMRVATTIQ